MPSARVRGDQVERDGFVQYRRKILGPLPALAFIDGVAQVLGDGIGSTATVIRPLMSNAYLWQGMNAGCFGSGTRAKGAAPINTTTEKTVAISARRGSLAPAGSSEGTSVGSSRPVRHAVPLDARHCGLGPMKIILLAARSCKQDEALHSSGSSPADSHPMRGAAKPQSLDLPKRSLLTVPG
jgi:hypothetical protein